MRTAWVIMTAMPPTKGHMNLIKFADSLPASQTKVLVSTQPHEPWPAERFLAIKDAVEKMHTHWHPCKYTGVYWLSDKVEQDPEAPGFWEYWDAVIQKEGFAPGDFWVTSEPYGQTLADRNGGVFIPFDPKRELLPIKATPIREDPLSHFDEIIPEFQRYIRKTVTVFGAESTGKTTLSKEIAGMYNGHWLFEWARPYLETVGPDIDIPAMEAIWKGQLAAQRLAQTWTDKPFIVQDTDLFSTVGYWMQPHWQEALGPVPKQLVKDALANKSDLYLITQANIPFEQDSIRYGDGQRESPDSFWIGIAEQFDLNYIVLEHSTLTERYGEATWAMRKLFEANHGLTYDRKGL